MRMNRTSKRISPSDESFITSSLSLLKASRSLWLEWYWRLICASDQFYCKNTTNRVYFRSSFSIKFISSSTGSK
jgi:hypothetical protein